MGKTSEVDKRSVEQHAFPGAIQFLPYFRARIANISLKLSLHERLVGDDFGSDLSEFESRQRFHLFPHGFKVALHAVDTNRDPINR